MLTRTLFTITHRTAIAVLARPRRREGLPRVAAVERRRRVVSGETLAKGN